MTDDEDGKQMAGSPPDETDDKPKTMKKRFKKKNQNRTNTQGFRGKTEEIREHTFVYSEIRSRSKKWITSKEKFIEYAGSKFSMDEELSIRNKTLTIVSTTKPTEKPKSTADKFEEQIYFMKLKRYDLREDTVRVNLTTLYRKLMQQCDPQMQSRIKAHREYESVASTGDVIGLMGIIEDICESGGETRYYPLQRILALIKLVTFKQTDEMSLSKYVEQFETLAKIAQKTGLPLVDEKMVEWTIANSTNEELKNVKNTKWEDIPESAQATALTEANDTVLATLFMHNANDSRYAAYKDDCHNNFIKGNNTFPKSIVDAHTTMDEFKPPRVQTQRGQFGNNKRVGHLFATDGRINEGTPSNAGKQYKCYNCDRWNQCISRTCPHKTKEDGSLTVRERRKKRDDDGHDEDARGEDNTDNNAEGQIESNLYNDGIVRDWDADLDENDYKFDFCLNVNGRKQGSKKVIIEDLKGKNKHVLNGKTGRLNPSWILLDNCSTVHVFYSKQLLQNIRTVDKELHLYTNAGVAIIDKMGDLPGFGPVWYHKEGIANILSFNGVSKTPGYQIEYQSWIEDAFKVNTPNGKVIRFRPSEKGLYYWNYRKNNAVVLQGNGEITTVRKNKERYSQRDAKRAEEARRLQHVAGQLTEEALMEIARKNWLTNSPITPRDVRIMKDIYGPSIPGQKGKTVRHKKPGISPENMPIPRNIMKHYQEITISIDIMFVNKIPFVTTISKHIHFGTATAIPKMEADQIAKVIEELGKFYKKQGFTLKHVLGDGQFKSITDYMNEQEIDVNTTSRDEHVGEIERYNRTIKERARSTYHNTPFKKIPPRMVIELIRNVVFYLNGFPWKKGVSKDLSPMTIMTGMKLDYNLHCKVLYGEYAQVREETDNTLKARSVGAIAMGPSQNQQGGVNFYSLRTGRILKRSANDYTLIPMPEEAIDRVHQMARKSIDGLSVLDRNGNEYEEEDFEVIEMEEEEDMNAETESVAKSDTSDAEDSNRDEDNNPNNDSDDDTVEATGVDDNPPDEGTDDESAGPTGVDDSESDSESTGGSESSNGSEVEDEGPKSSYGRVLRGTQSDEFDYQYFQGIFGTEGKEPTQRIIVVTEKYNELNNYKAASKIRAAGYKTSNGINRMVLAQYGLRAGLKRFGRLGKEATMKELRQMLRRTVFEEIDFETLSYEDKRNALPILLFLTEKRDGTVKGRACADGRKQKVWMQKEDSASPTVAFEALCFTLIMDAYEGRDVATCDLPGHFLQTDMEGRLILRLDGDLAMLLIELDPKRWRKHMRRERGRPVIYVRCNKAIYGTINAALLSYRKLIGHLSDWGFSMNPYDPCVWNKMEKGKQLTVVFHVDDMKISHKDPDVVTELIRKLEGIYATLDPMTTTRGKIHQYLGMTIDFRTKGEVRLSMYDYIHKMISELPADMIGTRATAASDHLFRTEDEEAEPLDEDTKEVFHHITAKSLYLGMRARPDLQTATSFLCTRVRNPNRHDYKKLAHEMKYLQATKHLPLILRSDGKAMSLYIDGAHAVHENMRGHAGVMVTAGKGTLYASSTKNKLNTTSSTETEIVSVGEKLPKFIWFRNFRIAQGYDNGEDILYQDNESAMLLENNGRMSCAKGSKHIHIRYFFVTDRIAKKDIRVEHCPTKEMIADYFTKPLQGALFKKFRDLILGIREEDFQEYQQQYDDTLKEFGLKTEDKSEQKKDGSIPT